MGLSKTEINLKRLLAAAPQQQNKAKLMHYVATLREQLEQLATEKTSEGFNRPESFTFSLLCVCLVSKALVSDYSDKIEAIAAKLASPVLDTAAFPELRVNTSFKENVSKDEEESIILSPGLRRRLVASSAEHKGQDTFESSESSSPVKLDAAAQAHITKHRKLQEDLTDEMVVLARQLKESSLTMNKSIQNTERILDSTEKAVEHSLATTGRANTQAMAIYSQGSKTSCFTWLLMFVMTCIFVMVVLLIKAT
ncbi:vesicle transport protein, Use1 [Artemisia annua]|uniref:Vesicle transport protein, Use1 n=1 Tax=Artemisia annua TaxID=35608 RepID=A0A2U1MZT4_ARTAN|nr:vesicle transport protein, Use1 [Artemisia annua]